MDHPVLADALAHDIIQSLSRLRWIRVSLRGRQPFSFARETWTLGHCVRR